MMADYTIEKNIYLHFNKEDKQKIGEILDTQINNDEIEITFGDVEVLFYTDMISKKHYEEIENEVDVTSYILLFN